MTIRRWTGTAAALALGLAALSTGTAFAQGSTAVAAPAPVKAGDKSASRRVCRNLVLSGSRLSSRVCRSQADWDKAMKDTQDAALENQNGPGGRPANRERGT